MIRQAVLFQARPGMAAEYERRHNPLWPDLEKALKDHGARNYSIFVNDATGQLFGYVEIDDEARFAEIAQTEVCQRWWRYIAQVVVCASDDSPKGQETSLREVFHLD